MPPGKKLPIKFNARDLFIALIWIVFSCHNEAPQISSPCSIPIKLEAVRPLGSSHRSIPYQKAQVLSFQNMEGQMVLYRIGEEPYILIYADKQDSIICEEDISRNRMVRFEEHHVTGKVEIVKTDVRFPKTFEMDLFTVLNIGESKLEERSDILNIYTVHIDEQQIHNYHLKLSVPVAHRGYVFPIENTLFHTSLQLFNTTFYKVYESRYAADNIKLFYTIANGLVAFTDLKGALWVIK